MDTSLSFSTRRQLSRSTGRDFGWVVFPAPASTPHLLVSKGRSGIGFWRRWNKGNYMIWTSLFSTVTSMTLRRQSNLFVTKSAVFPLQIIFDRGDGLWTLNGKLGVWELLVKKDDIYPFSLDVGFFIGTVRENFWEMNEHWLRPLGWRICELKFCVMEPEEVRDYDNLNEITEGDDLRSLLCKCPHIQRYLIQNFCEGCELCCSPSEMDEDTDENTDEDNWSYLDCFLTAQCPVDLGWWHWNLMSLFDNLLAGQCPVI